MFKGENNPIQPVLSTTQEVRAATDEKNGNPGQLVTLARGLHSSDQHQQIDARETAGGGERNDNAPRPTEQQGKDQVKFEAHTNPSEENLRNLRRSPVVEFTTDMGVALRFGRTRGGVIVVQIAARYLREGSTAEGGWVAMRGAPIRITHYYSSPTLQALPNMH